MDNLLAIFFIFFIGFILGKSKGKKYNVDRPEPKTKPPVIEPIKDLYGISLEPVGSHKDDPFVDQDPHQ